MPVKETGTPSVESPPSWLSPAASQLHRALTPVAATLESLRSDPSTARLLVQQQPEVMPELMREARITSPEIEGSIRDAIAHEFRRTVGYGANANKMFRAALALDGDGAEVVRAEFQALVAERDEQFGEASLPGTKRASVQRSLLDRTEGDPEFGRFYVAFGDRPEEAARMLLADAERDPATLERLAGDLHWMMQQSPATEAFVHAVMRLQGTRASLVQTLVTRELHQSMARDLRAVDVYDHVSPGMHSEEHVRVERLIPLLAELVSKPEVANALVAYDMRVEQRPEGMPTLQQLMDDMLRASYERAVLTDVHNELSQGGAEMLKRSLTPTDENAQHAWEETAGTFLGTAARAERSVGLERDVAAEMANALNELSKWTPGKAGKTMKVAGALLGLAPKHHQDMDWTQSTVNQLLQIVYAEARPRPAGAIGDENVSQWDDSMREWRRETASSFNAAAGTSNGER
jgi:hypothetical protein